MSFTTYLKNVLNAIACTFCIFRKAFNEWSPARLDEIIFWLIVFGLMDSLVKRWFRISSSSKGNIFKYRPKPGKKLPLNWDYIDTLDYTTKLNFHRLIAVTDERLQASNYFEMKEYTVLLFLLI